jgi:hypothetical protein
MIAAQKKAEPKIKPPLKNLTLKKVTSKSNSGSAKKGDLTNNKKKTITSDSKNSKTKSENAEESTEPKSVVKEKGGAAATKSA